MNQERRTPEILHTPTPGPVLVLAPHADDEVVGCGGTLALHAAQGDAIRVVVIFDGAAANQDAVNTTQTERLEYVARRESESRASLRILTGAEDAGALEFWRLPEGHEPACQEIQGGAQALHTLLQSYQPRTVYVPWPGDAHGDHRSVARAACLALRGLVFEVEAWGYEVWSALTPERVIDVSQVADRKRRALAVHLTQDGDGRLAHRALGLAAWRSACLTSGGRYAEAFVAIRPEAIRPLDEKRGEAA
ncbi:MAG: PIG-L deacetylase family protein [Planctomycetota bacterium]